MNQCSTCPHCGAPIYSRLLPNEGTADPTPEIIFSCQCRLSLAPRMAPLLIPIFQPVPLVPIQPIYPLWQIDTVPVPEWPAGTKIIVGDHSATGDWVSSSTACSTLNCEVIH